MTTRAAAPHGQIRSVEIVPLSHRNEFISVVRVAIAVVACAWIYAASRSPDTGAGRDLLAYQSLMMDLQFVEQRAFRELREGLLEAERVRATSGQWPEPSTLATDGIPPFARDPTTKGATYMWSKIQRGTMINYLGIPSGQAAPAWLLLIQEPEPGSPPDPAPDDEEHQRLPDGTVLHVSVWMHEDGRLVPPALTPLPQARGWKQILGRAPAAASR